MSIEKHSVQLLESLSLKHLDICTWIVVHTLSDLLKSQICLTWNTFLAQGHRVIIRLLPRVDSLVVIHSIFTSHVSLHVLKGDDECVEELINLVGLLICPLNVIKVANSVFELLVVNLAYAICGWKFAESLEVAFHRDTDSSCCHYKIINLHMMMLLEVWFQVASRFCLHVEGSASIIVPGISYRPSVVQLRVSFLIRWQIVGVLDRLSLIDWLFQWLYHHHSTF